MSATTRRMSLWMLGLGAVAALASVLWMTGVLPQIGPAKPTQSPDEANLIDGNDPDARAVSLEGAKGLIPPVLEQPTLPPPVDLDAVDRIRELHGVVVRSDGTPIAGATLQTFTLPWRRANVLEMKHWHTERLGPATQSARDGTFRLRLVPGSSVRVRAKATGFSTVELIDRQPGERVRVVLHVGVALLVTAHDPKQVPLSGVALELSASTAEGGASIRRTGTTGANGQYRFEDLPAGARVRVEGVQGVLGGWGSNWDRVTLPTTGVMPYKLEISPGRVIRGRVVDAETGQPVRGARVGMGWTFHKETLTDEAGHYALGGWTGNGYHEIHVTAKGYGRGARRVADLDTIDIELHAGFAAIGRVLNADGPLTNAQLAVVGSVRRNRMQIISTVSGTTDAQGRFRLDDLRRDMVHQLVVMPRAHGRMLVRIPKPASGAKTHDLGDLRVGPGILLRGRVLDADGKPMPRANLTLNGPNVASTDEWSGLDYGREETRVTDDLGRFAYADLAPGHYLLTCGEHGGDSATAEVRLEAGVTPPLATVRFEPRHALRATVVDEQDKPISGVTVYATAHGTDDRYAHTDASGVATMQFPVSVQRVRIDVHVSSEHYLSYDSADVTLDGKPHRIVLKTAAVCRGTIRDPRGEPLRHARIVARRDGNVLTHTFADAEGVFAMSLPPGGVVDLLFRGDVSKINADGRRTRRRVALEARRERVAVAATGVVLDAAPIEAALRLTIRVVDAGDKPLADAEVALHPPPDAGVGMATTDAKGLARFRGLTVHPVAVFVRPPKALRSKLAVTQIKRVVPAGQARTVQLVPPLLLEGVVVDAKDAPLAGAGVSTTRVIAGKQPGTKTDDHGRFVMALPPDFEGRMTVYATIKDANGVLLIASSGTIDPRAGPLRLVAKPSRGW